MKLVQITYQRLTTLLRGFSPNLLTDEKKINTKGVFLVVEGLDDFRGHVARAKVGVFVVYKTLQRRSAGSADSLLDGVIEVLLNNNIDVKKVGLVSVENGLMTYRIEAHIDIASEN